MLKVLYIGLGSIGTRHLINFSNILKKRNEDYIFDAMRGTNINLTGEIADFIATEYHSYNELPDDYDIAFISNPTYLHFDTLKKIVNKSKNIFIEKPIFNYSNISLQGIDFREDGIYYVACPIRYTKVIQYLKKEILPTIKVFACRVICSSYLPDWRKTDYTKCYSSMSEHGGGVSLDLIHEWDYIHYLFGSPQKIFNLKGKYSDLQIRSDDVSLYIAEYSDKLLSLHLDYFGKYPKREIELYAENNLIIADLINMQIRDMATGEVIDLKEDRDDFQIRELEAFLDMIDKNIENSNDINTALKVLKLVEAIDI